MSPIGLQSHSSPHSGHPLLVLGCPTSGSLHPGQLWGGVKSSLPTPPPPKKFCPCGHSPHPDASRWVGGGLCRRKWALPLPPHPWNGLGAPPNGLSALGVPRCPPPNGAGCGWELFYPRRGGGGGEAGSGGAGKGFREGGGPGRGPPRAWETGDAPDGAVSPWGAVGTGRGGGTGCRGCGDKSGGVRVPRAQLVCNRHGGGNAGMDLMPRAGSGCQGVWMGCRGHGPTARSGVRALWARMGCSGHG